MHRAFAGLIFFRREIENQKAIHSGFGRFAMERLESKLENRVQVSVEDNRDLRTPADLADAIEDAGNRRAGLERALGGELIDQAICQGIGKRNAELKDVDASFFESEREVDRARQIRIAGADVGDEGFFVSRRERGETLIDSIWHSR